jgi:hypothetical protein
VGSIDGSPEVTGIVALIIGEEAGGVFIALTPTELYEEYGPVFEAMLQSMELSAPVAAAGPESAGILLYGDSVTGTVVDESGVAWSFIGLEGESIDLIVEPTSDVDVVIDILNSSGESVLDGELDLEFDTETLEAFVLPATDTYTIIVRGFASGTGDYQLTLLETGSTVTASPAGDRESITGSVAGDEANVVTFNALAGEILTISVIPLSEDLDVVAEVLDNTGKSMFEDPTDASIDTEIIPFVYIPEDGVYSVSVTSYDGTPGDFEVQVVLSNNGETNNIVFTSNSLDTADETHIFPFYGLSGDSVSILVEPLEIEFDLVLGIYEYTTDELIEEVDFSTGIETQTFIIPEDGDYYFQISGYEGSVGNYDVMLMGGETVVFELAIGDEILGQFGANNLLEYYLGGDVDVTKTISVEPDGDTDVTISIYDFDYNLLASVDAEFGGGTETLEYTFESDDLVIIQITDFDESQGSFTMYIE